MKLKETGALFALAALWGASFLFIKIAAPVIGPLVTIQGRVTIAGVALFIFVLGTGRRADLKKWWKQYLILGALNAAIPFTLIASAELRLNASMAGILNSLTPLFTALIAWGYMKEKLTIKKWTGIVTGIVGVAILVGWSPLPLTKEVLVSICLSVLSTISYGFAGVYAKKAFSGVAPLSLATGQQLGAAVILLPFTVFNLPSSTASFSSHVILSVAGLAIFCTAIAYQFYFYLIANVGPTKTLSVTFLIPFFSMLWGIVFLNEKITFGMVIGLIVILGSVLFISDIPLSYKIKALKNR
jgi:drug/metabolite transporter (DMT)-like permease